MALLFRGGFSSDFCFWSCMSMLCGSSISSWSYVYFMDFPFVMAMEKILPVMYLFFSAFLNLFIIPVPFSTTTVPYLLPALLTYLLSLRPSPYPTPYFSGSTQWIAVAIELTTALFSYARSIPITMNILASSSWRCASVPWASFCALTTSANCLDNSFFLADRSTLPLSQLTVQFFPGSYS